MPAPTITVTRQALRERISRRLDDLVSGTASGGTTTTMTDTGDIDRYPTTPQYFLGAEVTIVAGTGATQSRHVTTHSKTGGTVTLTVPTWTAPSTDSDYEIHKIGGRGFTYDQYNDAINSAVDALADSYFTDLSRVVFASQQDPERHEYPIALSGLNYLYAVEYLNNYPASYLRLNQFDTYRNLGDATARTRLFQGFQVPDTNWYEWVVVPMLKVGSPTDNLTIEIHTNSSGVPSGTTVTDGTSDTFTGSTLDVELRLVPFRFNPPVYLSSSTQYHLVFVRSSAVNASNYYKVAEDDDNQYSDGTAGTYDASTYTAVSGSDFPFYIFKYSNDWRRLQPKTQWRVTAVGDSTNQQLFLPRLPHEAVPIRLLGLAPIAQPSADTTNIPIRPEWVEAFAVDFLLKGRAGRQLTDDYANAARAWAQQKLSLPRPTRAFPPNTVQLYTG